MTKENVLFFHQASKLAVQTAMFVQKAIDEGNPVGVSGGANGCLRRADDGGVYRRLTP